jgi:transcriptional regulator with XRE-family HTH domain
VAGRARERNTAYRHAFGQRIRELRDKQDLSQERLALNTGIARSYLGGIERGEKNPALDHIVKLAEGLGIQPADLMPAVPVPARRPRRS